MLHFGVEGFLLAHHRLGLGHGLTCHDGLYLTQRLHAGGALGDRDAKLLERRGVAGPCLAQQGGGGREVYLLERGEVHRGALDQQGIAQALGLCQ